MLKALAVLVLAVASMGAACQTTRQPPIVIPKLVQVKIPPELLKCPGVDWPKSETLTDKQVARLLVQLSSALETCRVSITKIKQWQVEVERQLASQR